MPVERSLFKPKPATPADAAPVQPAPAVVAPTPTPTPAAVVTPVAPTPTPTPAPVPTGTASGSFASKHPYLLAILVGSVIAIGFAIRNSRDSAPTPTPTPTPVDAGGFKAGRDFVPILGESLAQGFDALADKIDSGAKVEDADAALKRAFDAARAKAFADKASPGFAAIVPSGTEPKDDAARKAYSAYSRDFAKGLRGAR
ncbi:hypothetical protein [Singulisphaera sp. PoT]|uniref:hypothetical protein n=1 Tax=Singulisphaera sp. PoT TaxID=3411797 RepID=UPI003BF4AA29